MTDENNETPAPQGDEENNESAEPPRAKTPLEMVRERQAKMRGDKQSAGRSSQEGGATSPADAYKRRQHQRKSG